jgi:hypothetical protein
MSDYDDLKAKYGENFGLTPEPVHPKSPAKPLPSWAEVIEYYRRNPARWQALFGSDPDDAIRRLDAVPDRSGDRAAVVDESAKGR